jgi:predicted dienelactone hydrolase
MPLQLRVTAPVAGTGLPVIVLSHGHGPSLYLPSKDGYRPLADFVAGQGFVVIQPTHANSKVAGLPGDAAGGPLFFRTRAEEVRLVLDRLGEIEAMVPTLAGRIAHDRIGVVGHSLGGHTVSLLLGARMIDPATHEDRNADLRDRRILAGVLLAAPGRGGSDLNAAAAARHPGLGLDFSRMTSRALVVYGDADISPHLTVRGADWHADAYHLGPGAEALLTLAGAKHGLGGIAGYDARETDDEDPDRLAVVQQMTSAYLRSALHLGDPAWAAARKALRDHARDVASIQEKGTAACRLAG